jgi:group I intron endonuclease
MQYTVYKITNLVNGKTYIGCHQTDDPNDSYMGSGKIIKRAIVKYGLVNFTKTVLAVFDSQDQMFDEEKNLISTLCPEYNLHPGGNGGFQYVNSAGVNNQNKDMVAIGKKIGDKLRGRTQPDHVLQALRDSHQGRDPSMYATFTGRSHSDETKTRIGAANANHQSGSGNSRFGTQWITDGTVSKTISRGDAIPDGWRTGRVIRPK